MLIRQASTLVLGAGAMGSATAYHLARRGQAVTLVEQFALGHDRGSSHGSARIIRHSYADPSYAALMIEAFAAWRQLEADAAQPLYIRTGGVSISPSSVGYVDQVASSLALINVSHRRLSGREWSRIMPVFQVEESDNVVFEPDAGLISASRAVGVQVALAQRFGGDRTTTQVQTPVRRIDLEASKPTLVFDDHILKADRLVVTAGAWTSRLLPNLATELQPTRQQVLYFRPTDAEVFAVGRFPVFIFMGKDPLDAYYGMPAALGMGVKVARHGGPGVDPDSVNRTIDDEYRTEVRAFLARTIPMLAGAPVDRTEVCLYTMSEGERFRIGALPGRDDVIVASPCSGHGFKFSCLIGRVLADLAIDGQTSVDIRAWQWA